ncbi:MAG: tripartite tricarboxylate transporter TctB family protein [Deltaproteobacteria bacterium]|nr:tripartite tricarboxylate transporter TctB family protein [Deltaproteobacteria bacterium]
MTRRQAELLLLCGFLILAVLLYRSTAAYPPTVQNSTARYVRFLGLALGFFSLLELGLWFRKGAAVKAEKLAVAAVPGRFWGLFILLVVYSASLTRAGFYLASAVFLPLAMLLLGARKPLTIVLTTGGVLLFIYLVFARLLAVPLPAGTLF